MDFDDRLRNHLHAQTNGLDFAPEGSEAVRTRARKRKQQRTGGMVMATLIIALVAGGWLAARPDGDAANLATEGEDTSEEESTVSDAATSQSQADPPSDIENVLPDPGAALVLSTADNTNAPGGYNVHQNGRAGGLYYVLSTAPGVTWESSGDEFLRNDTIYTFDGSTWSQNSAGDRFISAIDANASGLLYTISTGSPTSRALELGTSSNAGRDWSWTELDLSGVFGPDQSSWPEYVVQHATRGSETLVVVRSRPNIDWGEAASLAATNGALIDPNSSEVLWVDSTGIGWFDHAETEADSCQASLNDAMNEYWESVPPGPEFNPEGDLTPEQQADLESYWAEQNALGDAAYEEALRSIGRVPGCETFVKCSNDFGVLSDRLDEAAQSLNEELWPDEEAREAELDDNAAAQLDALYESHRLEIEEWAETSGCDEVLPWLKWSEEGELGGTEQYATWENLGVAAPDSWRSTTAGFLVVDGAVTALGELFSEQDGFLAAVRSTSDAWTVTFDATPFGPGEVDPGPSYVVWTSESGSDWNATTSSSFDWTRPSTLSNGISISVDWRGQGAQLIRTSPNGADVALSLDDLAADLDTTGYMLMNVRAGDYGVVAWAVRWNDADDDAGAYDSIVLYSPDGVDWGATEVPDLEVIDAIVGAEEVVLFLNDPARADGAAQPIAIGRA